MLPVGLIILVNCSSYFCVGHCMFMTLSVYFHSWTSLLSLPQSPSKDHLEPKRWLWNTFCEKDPNVINVIYGVTWHLTCFQDYISFYFQSFSHPPIVCELYVSNLTLIWLLKPWSNSINFYHDFTNPIKMKSSPFKSSHHVSASGAHQTFCMEYNETLVLGDPHYSFH